MSLLEQLEATTRKYHDKELKNATMEKNYFFSKLFGKSKTFADGRSFTWPVKYAKASIQWLGEYEEQDTLPLEQITQAEVDYVWSSTSCVLSEQELAKNSGKERIVNLLSQKLTMLKDDVADGMATALTSGSGGKEPYGLMTWVQEVPGTTTPTEVAGITRGTDDTGAGTYTNWWMNQADDHSTTLADGMPDVEILKLKCTHGTERPDLFLCDRTTYSYLYANAASLQTEPHKDAAKLGFTSFTFDGIPVVWSDELPTASGTYGAQSIFMLRMADWELNFLGKKGKMHRTKWHKPEKQRAIVCYMYNDFAFLCKNPRNQGVMFDITGA